MKHLFTFLLVAISAVSFAQGNLQFNQVITDAQTFSLGTGGTANTSLLTVPADKVWKVESISDLRSVATSVGFDTYLIINGVVFNAAVVSPINFPIWLKSGDTVQLRFSVWAGSRTESLYISIIEFNVVP
jgi:hypothetical protein